MASLDGLTAGVDNKLTFTDLNGNIVVTAIENFTWKYDTSIPKKIYMDGTVRHPKLWQGVSGHFTVFRNTPTLELYFSEGEGAYLLGGDQIPVTITQTITNADGTTNQWQFVNTVLDLTDGGNYSGSDVVTQSVSFMAAARPKTF